MANKIIIKEASAALKIPKAVLKHLKERTRFMTFRQKIIPIIEILKNLLKGGGIFTA